jgi:hypothetical protein
VFFVAEIVIAAHDPIIGLAARIGGQEGFLSSQERMIFGGFVGAGPSPAVYNGACRG